MTVKGEREGTGRDPSTVQESGPPQKGHRGLRYLCDLWLVLIRAFSISPCCPQMIQSSTIKFTSCLIRGYGQLEAGIPLPVFSFLLCSCCQ